MPKLVISVDIPPYLADALRTKANERHQTYESCILAAIDSWLTLSKDFEKWQKEIHKVKSESFKKSRNKKCAPNQEVTA